MTNFRFSREKPKNDIFYLYGCKIKEHFKIKNIIDTKIPEHRYKLKILIHLSILKII